MQVKISNAQNLLKNSGNLFKEVFRHGSLVAEIYKPVEIDLQQPHSRDEVYIIISGKGEFISDGITCSFEPGDFLFVPAGKGHRFLNFSIDFSTWVLFYGPEGGED